jgi:hypothetical protein
MASCLILIATSASVQASAPITLADHSAPMGSPTMRATADQLLGLADQLVRRGNPDQAESIYDLLARDPNPDVRNKARYRTALMLESKGQTRASALLLRQILDEKPEAASVRLRLATALQKLGDEEAALRELRALRSANLPLSVARFVDRLSASLQATKPFGFQIEFALAPDSNINRATRFNTLETAIGDFTLDQETKSGVGAAVRGMAQGRVGLSDALNLVGRASSDARLYRDRDLNDISVDVAGGPEFRLGRTHLSLEGGATQQWFGMKPYQRSLRLSGSATRRLGAVSQLRLDISGRWSNYRLNNLQDGRGLSFRARYERALSPQMLVSASVGADRYRARDEAYSTRQWSAGISAYRDIGRMTVFAGLDVARLKADQRLQLLPATREDRFTRFHVGSVLRQLTVAGFAPMTRIVMERNRSTVEFYDYKRTWTEFGVSRAF